MTRNPKSRREGSVASWRLQDAKARFSEVCRLAAERGPQLITRQGRETVIVILESELSGLASRKKSKSLWELFEPLAGSGLVIERDKSLPREIDL